MKRMFIWLIALMFFGSSFAYAANEYTNSAHGNTGYGVDRKAPFPAYAVGNCAHCHEQHASIGGAEPAPSAGDAAGPDDYLLFDASHTSQTADVCFDCHVSSLSQQDGGYIYNYTYARRAGNYTDGLIGIKEAFDTGNASYHDLDDVVTFITGKWGYTANSNPCCGCHNPHAAQGDPSGDANVAKSSSTRGYPVSLPSAHATLTTWGLWGDEDGEKMDDYTTSNYQAPYRPGDATYEPDGSSTTTGSNLTDFVTFCLDCHENEVTSSSTTSLNPGTTSGKLTAIDWSSDGEKHGQKAADTYISVDAPYTAGAGALGYVLSCLDCHEPHGSSNKFLIREEVNGSVVGDNDFITVSSEDCDQDGRYTDNADDWKNLCSRCHDDDYEDIHHLSTDSPYTPVNCSECHAGPSQQPINCSCCHYHGSSAAGMVTF